MSEIRVSLNAPNWPKMVSRGPSSSSSSSSSESAAKSSSNKANIKMQCASSSLWLKSKYERNAKMNSALSKSQGGISQKMVEKERPRGEEEASILQVHKKKKVQFASKSRLLRQCNNCQILYETFHNCTAASADDDEQRGAPIFKQKDNIYKQLAARVDYDNDTST